MYMSQTSAAFLPSSRYIAVTSLYFWPSSAFITSSRGKPIVPISSDWSENKHHAQLWSMYRCSPHEHSSFSVLAS